MPGPNKHAGRACSVCRKRLTNETAHCDCGQCPWRLPCVRARVAEGQAKK